MLGVALGLSLLMLRLPPMPQPASYHEFADQRSWLGIPNFLNVISNIPFAVVGILGLAFVSRTNAEPTFIDPRERWAYIGVFAGLLLTAFGSAYYHCAPNNAHLVWDRLPMTIVFGSLLFNARFDLGIFGFFQALVLLLVYGALLGTIYYQSMARRAGA